MVNPLPYHCGHCICLSSSQGCSSEKFRNSLSKSTSIPVDKSVRYVEFKTRAASKNLLTKSFSTWEDSLKP